MRKSRIFFAIVMAIMSLCAAKCDAQTYKSGSMHPSADVREVQAIVDATRGRASLMVDTAGAVVIHVNPCEFEHVIMAVNGVAMPDLTVRVFSWTAARGRYGLELRGYRWSRK